MVYVGRWAFLAWVPGRGDLSTSTQGENMNKDQIKGTLKVAAGNVQQTTGKAIGSTEQELKGIQKKAAGHAQKAVGDIKEAVADLRKR